MIARTTTSTTAIAPTRPQFKPITRERERELIARFQQHGDESARAELLEAHKRFIWHLAQKRERFLRYCTVEDLVQIGLMSLFEAIPRYDLSRSTSLLGFAGFGIIRRMQQEMSINRLIHIPSSGRELEGTRRFAEAADAPIAFSGACFERASPDARLIDLETPDEEVAARESRRRDIVHVHQALRKLPPRLRTVLELRMLDCTLECVGQHLHVTKERVRQLEKRARELVKGHISLLRARQAPKSPAAAKSIA